MSVVEPAYAGFVTRFVAIAIDAGLLAGGFAVGTAVFGLVVSLFSAVEPSAPGVVLGSAAAWALVDAAYFALCWTAAGQTVGMRLLGLRVLGQDGAPPRLGQSLRRLVGMIVAAIPFFAGYVLILVDDRRRGLHDMIAGTFVVYVSTEQEAEPPTALTSVG